MLTNIRDGLLGAVGTTRGYVNTMTIVVAFIMSIMVINNYRECKKGKGYPNNNTNVNRSYTLAIVILVACCILFLYDLASMANLV